MIIFNVDFIYVYFKVLFVEMYVNVVFVESFYNTVTLTRVRTWRSIRIIYDDDDDDDDDEDYAHNLLCWHWCSSVYEKACLTRKVLSWILNLDRVGGEGGGGISQTGRQGSPDRWSDETVRASGPRKLFIFRLEVCSKVL